MDPAIRVVRDLQASAVPRDQLPDDGQAAAAMAGDAAEAGSVVCHVDDDLSLRDHEPHVDVSSGTGRPHGVVDYVSEDAS